MTVACSFFNNCSPPQQPIRRRDLESSAKTGEVHTAGARKQAFEKIAPSATHQRSALLVVVVVASIERMVYYTHTA